MDPILMFLSILPGVLICLYIYTRDAHDREPRGELAISFALGVLATIPVMFLEKWATDLGLDEPAHIGKTLVFSFFVVATVEELLKFLPLRLYAYPLRSFDEPMDGIVHAIMIGMGFATLENMLYADLYGYETMLLRAFTAVPAHACFAVIMGHFVGLAKFDPLNRKQLIARGLIMSIGLHGFYDFFLLQENIPGLAVVSLAAIYIAIFFAKKLIRQHLVVSAQRKQLIEQEGIIENDNTIT